MPSIGRAATLSLAIAAIASCKPQERASAPGDSSAAPTHTLAAAPTPNVVMVRAKDYAFDAPAQIPAGMTTFRLDNDGPALHHMLILRLDSGKTFTDLQRALKRPGPPPVWAVPVGGPNAPDPHAQSNATVDLAAGDYALVCLVDVPGGVPHFARGMSRPLTVTAGSTPAASAPTPDITVTLSDYNFDVSGPFTAGSHTFVVRTSPGQPHELELVRLDPGKTAPDIIAWIMHPKGPPPGHALGGAGPSMGGTPVYFTSELTAGRYALICFLPDAKDGKPHFMHGMTRTFDVT